MAGQIQTLRRRVRSTRSTKKITKAQELVATSRIAKAQERVAASRPYAQAITEVLTALASNTNIDHPLLVPRERVRRAGVVVVTSDRGLCGAYNANAIRTAEQLIARLQADGKQVALFVIGRKGVTYYRFRNREIVASWTGFSEQPHFENAREIGETLIQAFVAGADDVDGGQGPDGVVGVDELHLVSTQFRSLMTPRRAAAEVHQHPHLRGVDRLGGQRVGVAPAGHEECHRQRGRDDQNPDAPDEHGAPGGDHPGDQ